MPRMDQAPNQSRLAKLLLIGDGKIGKSFYAGMPGAENMNILYLNGDVAGQTLSQLPIEAQRNIYLMEMGDTILGGMRDTKFMDSMTEFTTMAKVRWNDTHQRIAKRNDTDEIWEITPGKMDSNCILVMDSWTSLVESMMLQAARANSVDLANATTSQMRPVYQSAGLKATAMLQIIRSVPCHVIVIAHPDEYQHKTAPEGRRVQDVKEIDMVIDWTKMIPKSTSRPHGLQMAKYFTDVAWMETSPNGKERRLNFRLKNDRISGGHFDDLKSSEEYSFTNLIRRLGGSIPNAPVPIDSWLNIIPAGTAQVDAPAKVLDGTSSVPVKGLAGLGLKKG